MVQRKSEDRVAASIVGPRGQVVTPAAIRAELGLKPGRRVEFVRTFEGCLLNARNDSAGCIQRRSWEAAQADFGRRHEPPSAKGPNDDREKPSTRTLERLATATGKKLKISFEPNAGKPERRMAV
ncbi:MAG: AbrB/MazE/SpoVT family DNA-binding domain-containing protein [Rhizomicrobium sp.]